MIIRGTFLGCLLCLLPFFQLYSNGELDGADAFLEPLLLNDSIVDTKQIKVPGYPNAYNPSLIPHKEGYLLSFRSISKCPKTEENPFRTDFSLIGIARLDESFNVSKKSVQLLNIVSHSPQFSLTAEDGRLLSVGNRIFLFFNDLPMVQINGGFAMYFVELVEEGGLFVLKGPAKPLYYPKAIPIEKNWSPFASGERLYVIYSSAPWVILEVDVHTGYCQEVTRRALNWNWELGEIRGGTPAYLVNETLLTFFHSSFLAKTAKRRAYVIGACTFDKEPPFSVRTMTPRPLGNLTDYTQENSAKVLFPGGMVVEDQLIHVAWGKADNKILITTFNKEKLLGSMKSLSPIP